MTAAAAASMAKKWGFLPGNLEESVRAAREPRTDWRAHLRQFLEQVQPSDYSWQRPARMYLPFGLYLPGQQRENMPRIGIFVDTSRSTTHLREMFAVEATSIIREARPEAVDVIYVDTHVRRHQEFLPDDELTFEMMGGGGTIFQPGFDWFTDAANPPAAVIVLTDLEADEPMEPAYPVLWCTDERCILEPPFGEKITVSEA